MKTTNTATSAVTEGGVSLRAAGLNEYVTIARPDHWFKNIFMLPGMLFAYLVYQTPLEPAFFLKVISGIACTCLIASANYVINEYLDVQFDRFHPVKKFRSGVQTVLNPYYVILQWFLLAASGLLLSLYINLPFMLLEAFLLFMGLMYNVKPFRTKDRVYLDVLSESVNNPIRLALGWFIFVPAALLPNDISDFSWVIIPPSSIILAYWMGGAFLMATKRFAEYRFIGNPEQAGLYRRSFKFYTENSLLISMFFYALVSAFFLCTFCYRSHIFSISLTNNFNEKEFREETLVLNEQIRTLKNEILLSEVVEYRSQSYSNEFTQLDTHISLFNQEPEEKLIQAQT